MGQRPVIPSGRILQQQGCRLAAENGREEHEECHEDIAGPEKACQSDKLLELVPQLVDNAYLIVFRVRFGFCP